MNCHLIFLKKQNFKLKKKILNLKLYNDDEIEFLNSQMKELLNLLNNKDLAIHVKKFYIIHKIKNKYKCPICLELMADEEDVYLTLCGHLFHYNCLDKVNENSDNCPICRTILGNENEK
jgi:rubrerythrin